MAAALIFFFLFQKDGTALTWNGFCLREVKIHICPDAVVNRKVTLLIFYKKMKEFEIQITIKYSEYKYLCSQQHLYISCGRLLFQCCLLTRAALRENSSVWYWYFCQPLATDLLKLTLSNCRLPDGVEGLTLLRWTLWLTMHFLEDKWTWCAA